MAAPFFRAPAGQRAQQGCQPLRLEEPVCQVLRDQVVQSVHAYGPPAARRPAAVA